MRRLNRYTILVCIGLMTVFFLIGCAKGTKATKSTLYIEKNGKVTGAIVEDWDDKLYDEKELEKQINEEIDTYSKSDKNVSVKLKKFEIDNNKAKVNLLYDSLSTYSDFNNVVAFNGTVKEAQKEGYEISGELISTGNKPSITIKELDGSEKYCVIILSERQKIETGFKILYASKNVKVSKGNKTAVIEDSDSENAYIIYKK